MSNVSIYLIKESFEIVNRYTIKNNEVFENKNSVFDKPVCLFDQQRIAQHLLSLKGDFYNEQNKELEETICCNIHRAGFFNLGFCRSAVRCYLVADHPD